MKTLAKYFGLAVEPYGR